MRIKIVLTAIVTGLALTACACSPDPGPGPQTTAATSPTSSPTATPPPPTLPATARADSPAGAEAFARHWLVTLDYAYQTGNTSPLRAVARCAGCDALADGIDKSYSAGNHIDGGRFTLNEAKIERYMQGATASVRVTYSSTVRRVIQPNGDVTEVPAENGTKLLLTMKRSGESWLITNAQPIK